MRGLILILLAVSLMGCQSDAVLEHQLAGTWDVTFKAGSSENTTPIEEEEKPAPEEATDPAAGLQKMADGLTQLGEGLKSLGEGLVDAITENLTFTVVLNEDGTMKMGKSNQVEFDLADKDIRWEVSDGNLLLSTQKDTMTFAIHKTADGFELQGTEGFILLKKPSGN